jgi:hypothetical protein
MTNSSKYVIDRILGGSLLFEKVLESEGAASETSNEGRGRVWPWIPSEYESPAAQHEEAVKECTFYPSEAEWL